MTTETDRMDEDLNIARGFTSLVVERNRHPAVVRTELWLFALDTVLAPVTDTEGEVSFPGAVQVGYVRRERGHWIAGRAAKGAPYHVHTLWDAIKYVEKLNTIDAGTQV